MIRHCHNPECFSAALTSGATRCTYCNALYVAPTPDDLATVEHDYLRSLLRAQEALRAARMRAQHAGVQIHGSRSLERSMGALADAIRERLEGR